MLNILQFKPSIQFMIGLALIKIQQKLYLNKKLPYGKTQWIQSK